MEDSEGARALVQAAYESPVTCIGIDTEYRFEQDHPIRLRGDSEWYDIRSVRPFCLAFAILSEDRLLRFVVDLRVASLLPLVQEVLDLPVPFACHHAQAELFVLWSLGLREPRLVWDTLLAEKALRLGRCPLRARARRAEDDAEAVQLKRVAAAEETESLAGADSGPLRDHGPESRRQGDPPGLVPDQAARGALDPDRGRLLRGRCPGHRGAPRGPAHRLRPRRDRRGPRPGGDALGRDGRRDRVGGGPVRPGPMPGLPRRLDTGPQRIDVELRDHGITNPNNSQQLGQFLKAHALDRHFPKTKGGQPCTKDDVLEARAHLHPRSRWSGAGGRSANWPRTRRSSA